MPAILEACVGLPGPGAQICAAAASSYIPLYVHSLYAQRHFCTFSLERIMNHKLLILGEAYIGFQEYLVYIFELVWSL